MLDLRLLGGFHAFLNGREVFRLAAQPNRTALLVYLALRNSTTRDVVTALLWPEHDKQRARHALSQTLHRLRAKLGDDWIEADGEQLSMAATVEVDTRTFETLIEAGAWERAITHFGGPFLAGCFFGRSSPFEHWVDQQRDHFEHLHRRARREAIRNSRERGDLSASLRLAKEWTEIDPGEDEARHRLIELLAESGHRAEALDQLERYRRRLKEDGLPLMDETVRLRDRLRHATGLSRFDVNSASSADSSEHGLTPEIAAVDEVRSEAGEAPAVLARSAMGGAAVAAVPVVQAPGRSFWRRSVAGVKDHWRLASAAAGVAVLVLGLVGAWALRSRSSAVPSLRARGPVLVLPFEVNGSDPGLRGLGADAAVRIAAAIEEANIGGVVSQSAIANGQALTARSLRRAVAKTGAGTLVTGRIAQHGDDIEIIARLARATDQRLVWTLGPVRGSAAEPAAALDSIRDRVLGAVAWYLLPSREDLVNPGIFSPPPSLEVFRLNARAETYFVATRWAEAIPRYREAFARDTSWLPAAAQLESAYWETFRWQQSDSLLEFLEARRGRLSKGDALRLDVRRALRYSREEQVRASRALLEAEPTFVYSALLASRRAGRATEALEYYALRDTSARQGLAWQLSQIVAGRAYHMLLQFDAQLALARAAKAREPAFFFHWAQEMSALAALGRLAEIDRIIEVSHGLETPGAAVLLMHRAALELSRHGWPGEARGYAARVLAGIKQWPDSLRGSTETWPSANATAEIREDALRILGQHEEIARFYEERSRRAGAAGLGWRILGMRARILTGDTVGAMALVDSARTEPPAAFTGVHWRTRGDALYHGAQILSLLGLGEEAVNELRAAFNNGQRVDPDELLMWYWAPIKDYASFKEVVGIR